MCLSGEYVGENEYWMVAAEFIKREVIVMKNR
jgi:hypothetical protein